MVVIILYNNKIDTSEPYKKNLYNHDILCIDIAFFTNLLCELYVDIFMMFCFLV